MDETVVIVPVSISYTITSLAIFLIKRFVAALKVESTLFKLCQLHDVVSTYICP